MRSAALVLALVGLLPSAQAQAPRLEDQLLGVWKCQSSGSDAPNVATVTYLTGGKETFELAAKIGEPLNLEFTSVGAGNWTLKDGVLVETITSFKYKDGKKNGRPTAPGFLETILGEAKPPGPITSTVEINGDVMLLRKKDGAVGSTCKR